MPRIAGGPPPAATPIDDVFGPRASSPPPESSGGLVGPLGIALVFLLLIFGGAFGALWWQGFLDPPAPQAPPQAAAPPAPTWSPGTGPLVDGLPLPDEPPTVLHWSPDGRQIGWITFDPERARRVAHVVSVRERFGDIEQLDENPDWLVRPVPSSSLSTTVHDGVVVLRGGPSGHDAFVDLVGSLGLNEPRTPALYERGGRVWLAVVGHRGAPGAPMSLHVVEVTSLLR